MHDDCSLQSFTSKPLNLIRHKSLQFPCSLSLHSCSAVASSPPASSFLHFQPPSTCHCPNSSLLNQFSSPPCHQHHLFITLHLQIVHLTRVASFRPRNQKSSQFLLLYLTDRILVPQLSQINPLVEVQACSCHLDCRLCLLSCKTPHQDTRFFSFIIYLTSPPYLTSVCNLTIDTLDDTCQH